MIALALAVSAVLALDDPGALPPATAISVDPAAPTSRVLEWSLRPSPPELVPGNAAIRYLQAAIVIAGMSAEEEQRIDALRELDFADLRTADSSVLDSEAVAGALDLLSKAALQESCDWGTSLQSEGIGLLLPELGALRRAARALSLRIEVDLARGDLHAARRSLVVGFALAEDVAQGPTLIQGLVGIAIASLSLDHVEKFIQADHAPNLYWPLTHLHAPIVDLSHAADAEMHLLEVEFPEFARIISGELSSQAMADAARRLLDPRALMNPDEPAPRDFTSGVRAAAIATAVYPRARASLLAEGITAAQIDAMPVAAVAVRGITLEFARERDAIRALFGLPYWQARADLQAAAARLEARDNSPGVSMLLSLLPSLSDSAEAQARLDRRHAAIRVIEALRAHAAEAGRFPASLDQITAVPVPSDPMTGLPFDYRLDGDAAVLSATPPVGCEPRSAIHYRITLRK